MKTSKPNNPKPIHPIHQGLKFSWLGWLIFRFFIVTIGSVLLMTDKRSIMSGIAWQGLWLMPAFCCTPSILKGKNPYALVMISMVTLLYLGGSGMVLTKYGFAHVWGLMVIWLVDFLLLVTINYWLFILLKRLPKMNG